MAAEENQPTVQDTEKPEHKPEPQPKMSAESSPSSKGSPPMASKSSNDSTGRSVLSFLLIFVILAGLTAVILWLVYRPHKPHFAVVGAAIYQLNTTSPLPFMSTTMQFTVVSRNPNKRISIYYDHLTAYVSYRNQAITPSVMLPELFHDKKSTVALSPILGGGEAVVPVSMEVVNGLVSDEAYGVLGLRLVLMGKLRWKLSGGLKSRKYGVIVKCDMLVGFKKGFLGQVPLLGSPECNVDI